MWWHRKPTGAGNSSAAGDEKAMSSVNFYTIHPGVDIDSLTFRWLSTQRKKVLSLPQNRGPEAASASSSRATEDSAAEITSTALVNSSKIFGPANQIAGLPTVNYPMAATTTEHEDSSYLTPTSDVSTEEASAIVSQAGPQFLPSQFGFQTNMEGSWDRRFWDFCKPSIALEWRAEPLSPVDFGDWNRTDILSSRYKKLVPRPHYHRENKSLAE